MLPTGSINPEIIYFSIEKFTRIKNPNFFAPLCYRAELKIQTRISTLLEKNLPRMQYFKRVFCFKSLEGHRWTNLGRKCTHPSRRTQGLRLYGPEKARWNTQNQQAVTAALLSLKLGEILMAGPALIAAPRGSSPNNSPAHRQQGLGSMRVKWNCCYNLDPMISLAQSLIVSLARNSKLCFAALMNSPR